MKRFSWRIAGLVSAAAFGASAAAWADNPLGLYVGAGVGAAHINNNNGRYDPYGYSGGFDDHDAAWKVIAGLRPLSIVGAEVEYIDFGGAGGSPGFYHGAYDTGFNEHPKASVLYGVGYLPVPLPFLDVYGKLGVARLQTNNTYYSTTSACALTPGATCTQSQSRFDQQNTRLAYGVGVQAKYQDFAVRGEYERISSSFGDPSALTINLTYTF